MFLATLRYWYTCSARPHHVVSGAHSWRALRGGIKKCTIPYGMLRTIVGIFPGTFLIFKSRDFWTFLVPGPRDLQGLQVLSCLVPGPRTSHPGTYRDVPGPTWKAIWEKKLKKSIQMYMFFYFCSLFLTKLLIFDRALVMNFSGEP